MCITDEVDTCATDHLWANIVEDALGVTGLLGLSYDASALESFGEETATRFIDSLYE